MNAPEIKSHDLGAVQRITSGILDAYSIQLNLMPPAPAASLPVACCVVYLFSRFTFNFARVPAFFSDEFV